MIIIIFTNCSVLHKAQECIFWKMDYWKPNEIYEGTYQGILQVTYSVIRGGMVRAELQVNQEYVLT